MEWNTCRGIDKRMRVLGVIRYSDNPENPDAFTLAGKPLFRVQEAEYVEVYNSASHCQLEVEGADPTVPGRGRLKSCTKIGLHGRGLSPTWCLWTYTTWLRLMYEYMIYLQSDDVEAAAAVEDPEGDLFRNLFGR